MTEETVLQSSHMYFHKKTRSLFANVIGWYGVTAILMAYILLNADIVQVRDYSYQLLNLTGAIGLLLVSAYHKDYQPAILNLIWAIIACAALVRLL